MAITVKCSGCDKKYQLRDDAAGKTIACKECGAKIPIPKPKSRPAAKSDDDEFAIPNDADEEFAPVVRQKNSKPPGQSLEGKP